MEGWKDGWIEWMDEWMDEWFAISFFLLLSFLPFIVAPKDR